MPLLAKNFDKVKVAHSHVRIVMTILVILVKIIKVKLLSVVFNPYF